MTAAAGLTAAATRTPRRGPVGPRRLLTPTRTYPAYYHPLQQVPYTLRRVHRALLMPYVCNTESP